MFWRDTSYAYPNAPYAWGGSVAGSPYADIQTVAGSTTAVKGSSWWSRPVIRTRDNQQQSDATNNATKRKWLIAVTVVLAVLLFGIIVALIVTGVMISDKTDQSDTAEQTNTVTVGFDVTRTDLTYTTSLEDSTSVDFITMNSTFCTMINDEWFQSVITGYTCNCIQFRLGSVVATVNLVFVNPSRTADEILSDAQLYIPSLSSADPRVYTIAAENIYLV